MLRLRTTAGLSALVVAGAVGMSLWMSAWPRMHDRATEAAVAARQGAGASTPAPAARPAHRRSPPQPHATIKPARAAPPAPPAPAYAPSPAYPIEALRERHEGVVTLRVHVDGTGTVTAVSVADSSGDPALDASARQAVRQWRFHAPANDRPMVFDYPLAFRIRGGDSP